MIQNGMGPSKKYILFPATKNLVFPTPDALDHRSLLLLHPSRAYIIGPLINLQDYIRVWFRYCNDAML
jgi:hypothetical protein